MMKNKIEKLKHNSAINLFLMSVLWIMICIPILSKLHVISRTFRISIVFLIINTIISAIIGRSVRLKNLPISLILIFPIIFELQVIINYGRYGYYFGAIYLLVSLLSYILTSKK